MKFRGSTSLAFLLAILLLALLTAPVLGAGEKHYTREHSEELFPLIEWREYGPAAFTEAIEDNKPIYFVLSADDWCYWCHVYESEDYLFHEVLYPYINEHFIPIYVNADKRKDLTRQYLEGGWPSTTVFAPDRTRLTGFSGPRDPHQLREYLEQVVVYTDTNTFALSKAQEEYKKEEPILPSAQAVQEWPMRYLSYIGANFDPVYGGFGFTEQPPEWREGQKFPQGLALQFLGEISNEQSLALLKKTFDAHDTLDNELTTNYNLYDPVEGGIHRYSTKRDWTIPHFEKMLYDQARILPAYAHLTAKLGDERARTVIKSSIDFVMSTMMEKNRFLGSVDAHLEGEYFYKTLEERKQLTPPHVDTESYTDSSAQMIVGLFSLGRTLQDESYAHLAIRTLDFLNEEMLGKEGAYAYYEGGEAKLTGQLTPNAWLLLANIEAYEYTKEKGYLNTAKEISDYILDNFFDWYGGGFFERNSREVDRYAPGENVRLSKPYEENALVTFSFLRLHLIEGDDAYLVPAFLTFGRQQERLGGLDASYYMAKSAQVMQGQQLLNKYSQESFASVLEKGQRNFFLTRTAPVQEDDLPTTNFFLLIILAFFAGLLSFLSPCTLPILPGFFAAAVDSEKKKVTSNILHFLAGLAVTFSVLGMGASVIGRLLPRTYLFAVGGVIVIIFGLLQIFGKGFGGVQIPMLNKSRNLFVFGMSFGIGWSACIGPILASLLVIAATSLTAILGIFLLLIYAAGLGLPLFLAAYFFDRIKKKKAWKLLKGKSIKFTLLGKKVETHSMYVISGIILVILGVLILNGSLYSINQLALQSEYVQGLIIRAEEWLLTSIQ